MKYLANILILVLLPVTVISTPGNIEQVEYLENIVYFKNTTFLELYFNPGDPDVEGYYKTVIYDLKNGNIQYNIKPNISEFSLESEDARGDTININALSKKYSFSFKNPRGLFAKYPELKSQLFFEKNSYSNDEIKYYIDNNKDVFMAISNSITGEKIKICSYSLDSLRKYNIDTVKCLNNFYSGNDSVFIYNKIKIPTKVDSNEAEKNKTNYPGRLNETVKLYTNTFSIGADIFFEIYGKYESVYDAGAYYRSHCLYYYPLKLVQMNKPLSDLYNRYGYSLYKATKYEEAISFFKKAVSVDSMHKYAFYNISCSYSLQSNVDSALVYLVKAQKRYENKNKTFNEKIMTDTDFNNIKDTKEFIEFINKQ